MEMVHLESRLRVQRGKKEVTEEVAQTPITCSSVPTRSPSSRLWFHSLGVPTTNGPEEKPTVAYVIDGADPYVGGIWR